MMKMKDITPCKWPNDSSTSNKSNNYQMSINQELYILPHENRPNLSTTSSSKSISIPIIDLNNNNESNLVHEVAKACEEFGCFMLINHGISQELCHNVLDVFTNFFKLPLEEKIQFFSDRFMDDGKIFRHHLIDDETKEKIGMGCEAFFHTWHPVELGFIQKLPMYPSHLRETIASYAMEIGPVMDQLLGLLSKGLGLNKDYLQRRLEENPLYTAQANYYPLCPNPDQLTLGLQPHTDSKVLGIILQDQGVTGLHVLKDQKWIAVDPIPASLVVNIADQLEVLSNDKYKSVYHRAVTNNVKQRVSFATFYGLNKDSTIGPIQELIDEHHRPLHPNYNYLEFHEYCWRKQEKLAIKQHPFPTQSTTTSLSLAKFTNPSILGNPKLNLHFPKNISKFSLPSHFVPKLSNLILAYF